MGEKVVSFGRNRTISDASDTSKISFARLATIRSTIKKPIRNMSMGNQIRIVEQKTDGTAVIGYTDVQEKTIQKHYEKTEYVKSEVTERVEHTHYRQDQRVREPAGLRKCFKIEHKIEKVKQKRWVKKTRMVKKPHICI